jgi:uncharacterized protein DUF4242
MRRSYPGIAAAGHGLRGYDRVTVPRYLIERFFDRISDEDMLAATVRSDRLMAERYPEITWEHSHVVMDDDGAIKTYCVYSAPTETMLREHADGFGAHVITNLYEIVEDVTPDDVRRRAAEANL